MFLCWIILSFVACGSLGQSIKPISTSSGLYYEQIGDVLLSNNNWEFVTSIDYGGYLVFYEYIHQQAQKLQEFCQKYKSTDCENRFKAIQAELNRIEDTDESMANFLGIKYANRRVKRFWNEIGNFFSTLGRRLVNTAVSVVFGSDSQPNLAVYDNAIANLKSGQADIENRLNEQRTVFLVDSERKTQQIQWLEKTQGEIQGKIDSLNSDVRKDAAEKAKQIEELKNMLNETNNRLREQEQKQKKLEGDVGRIKESILKIDERVDNLDDSVKLNSFSIDFGFLINLFKTEQEKLYDVIKKAKRGELDPYVLSPLKLIEMLQEIRGQLSEEHQLPFHPSIENAQYLYNIIKLKVILYKNKLIFVMNIPLVNYKKFGIHKMTSMPVSFAPNRFLFILPQEPFLIVDNSNHEYLLMSLANFKDYCEEISEQRYLCKQVDQLSQAGTDDSCEMQLFSTGLDIPRSCNIRMMEIRQSLFLQLQKSRSWIYAAKTGEAIIMSCNGVRKSIALIGSGFLSISEACLGRVRDLTLVPLLELTKPVSSNYSADINLADFVDLSDVDDLEVKTIKRIKNIISPFDFDILEANSFPITESFKSLIWLYIFLAMMIIIVATFGFLVYKKKINLEIMRNWVPFIPKEPTEAPDPDDRLKVKVKLHNKDEKITRISMHEDPSSNDPEVEYLTVRFKVKKQNNDKKIPANEKNDNLCKATKNMESKENDYYLQELRKLKPYNKY